jgi:phospholipid transport system substrate-binding protein
MFHFKRGNTVKAIVTRATGVFALLLALCVQAQGQSPDVVVKTTTDEVLAAIKTTKDQKALIALAEQKVLQRFDFKRMTQLAVGQSWAKATPAQQEALERAFRTLLVRTYTAALSQSSGNTKVDIKPTSADGGEATVRTMVTEPGRKPFNIDYRMHNGAGDWKVYDVVVENLSLVTNYRGSFQSEIGRSGIDGLIKVIEERNQKLRG